ncbi:MAG: hypothetical protein JNK02_06305 [Planctomycetes bacterium]|nr:hypothetical protein [Planctomycetota bacterium]
MHVCAPLLLVSLLGFAPQDSASIVKQRAAALLHPLGVQVSGRDQLALGTLLEAQDAYRAGDWHRCQALLDALWKRHPVGAPEWAARPPELAGTNFGNPTCYYALRMLTDCVRWRRAEAALPTTKRPRAREATLSVVLVGRSQGIEPRSMAELAAGSGTAVTHELHPLLLEQEHRVIRESLWLFLEYVLASTDGRLSVTPRFEWLPELSVEVEARAQPRRVAGLAAHALDAVWAALPPERLRESDWWWVLYPSHVPERHPEFATTEFITGGMTSGPFGGPCFLIDDLWLVRKPPHLGRGPYGDEERRAYLPQWLQHEFFHHLFGAYPQFGLEAESHQWFDRQSWPEDFAGRFEADYYQEALHKRLRTPAAQPPLHLRLCYAGAPLSILRRLSVRSLEGDYVREPVENDWHRVKLKLATEDRFEWRNTAGVRWTLTLDREAWVLRAGQDNPYHDPRSPRRNDVLLELRRDAQGEFVAEIEGLRVGGELYRRTRARR